MRGDPRVIRWTMLKIGEKIEDVVKDREVTVDRSSQMGTGHSSSLKFLGSLTELGSDFSARTGTVLVLALKAGRCLQ